MLAAGATPEAAVATGGAEAAVAGLNPLLTSACVCGVFTGGVAAVAAGEWAPACSSGLTSVGV